MSPRRRRLGHAATAVAVIVAWAGVAHAQSAGTLTLDTFRPAMDSRGYFTVNASQVLGDKDVSFGLGALDYGRNLLDLSMPAGCTSNATGCTSYTINNILTATLVGAFGIHAGPADQRRREDVVDRVRRAARRVRR